MNNVKNKIIHIIFKMIQTQSMWDEEYQRNHMKAVDNIHKNDIGTTEVAPMDMNLDVKEKHSQTLDNSTSMDEEHFILQKQQNNGIFICIET